MKVVLWKAEKGYENALGPLLREGAARHGDELTIKPLEVYEGPEGDAGMIIGVVKRKLLWDHRARAHPLIYIDKGYSRSRAPWGALSLPAWWRMCWNAVHPTDYLMRLGYGPGRTLAAGWAVPNLASRWTGHILLLGSSAKFHETMMIQHPTDWAKRVVADIRLYAKERRIIYRPKPSWADAQPVEGTEFHHGAKTPIGDDLDGAFASVTYGSIACVDSILAGVPCIVLGNAVARDLGSRTLSDINAPHWFSPAMGLKWLANLSYCQWSPGEIQSGLAWQHLKEQKRYAE